MELENALVAKELELQTLLGLAEENAKPRLETNRMQHFFKVLNRESEPVQLICEDVRDPKTVARDVWTQAEAEWSGTKSCRERFKN